MKIEELPPDTAVVDRDSEKFRRIHAVRQKFVSAGLEWCHQHPETTADEILAALMLIIAQVAVDNDVPSERMADIVRVNCDAVRYTSRTKGVS